MVKSEPLTIRWFGPHWLGTGNQVSDQIVEKLVELVKSAGSSEAAPRKKRLPPPPKAESNFASQD